MELHFQMTKTSDFELRWGNIIPSKPWLSISWTGVPHGAYFNLMGWDCDITRQWYNVWQVSRLLGLYAYMYVYIYIYMCVCMYIYIYMCVYMYVYVCVCIYIYVCTNDLKHLYLWYDVHHPFTARQEYTHYSTFIKRDQYGPETTDWNSSREALFTAGIFGWKNVNELMWLCQTVHIMAG